MFTQSKSEKSVGIFLLTVQMWESVQQALPAVARQWAQLNNFEGKAGQVCLLPDECGGVARVLAGYDATEPMLWAIAGLPDKLPEGHYHLQGEWEKTMRTEMAIGWGLGCYQFHQFRSSPTKPLPCLFLCHHIAL